MIPQIGKTVNVVKIIDDTTSLHLLGMTGRVVHYDYACGCGQSYPDDPMIGVEIAGQIFEFWKEELKLSF